MDATGASGASSAPSPIGRDSFTIINAAIFDGHALLQADTIVVENGMVTAIGEGGSQLAPEQAEIIDARGGLITPGFVDAHVHPVFAGVEALELDLSECAGTSAALDAVRARLLADEREGRQGWVKGGGWSMSDFAGGAPTAALLDSLGEEIGVDRPIQLISADHHSSWVNSAALRIAGVDAETPTPPGGVIERDEHGNPTGTLHEAAVDLVGVHAPQESPEQLRAGLLEAQRRLHAVGVTGYIDAIIGAYLGHGDTYEAYVAARDDEVLTCEVTGSLWWGRNIQDPEEEAKRLAGLRTDGERFRTTNVKFMLDGIVESQTAAMVQPYQCACASMAGGTAGGHGTSYFTREHLRKAFRAVQEHGFDIHCHAIGDAAVREGLDAMAELPRPERMGQDDPESPRHHLAHLQVVDPVDVPRLAQLHVTANLQALWAHYDQQLIDLNLPVLGEERAQWLYPFGDLAASGAQLAMGSDWPVSSPDPWQAIHVAVNRTHPTGARNDPLLPHQALDLLTCLAAYTTGSARLARTRTAGRLSIGAPADLALANVNPFTLNPTDLHTTHNTLTVAAGRIVFRDVALHGADYVGTNAGTDTP